MKILFVGQAPSKETEGKPAFVGKCGAILASLMGMTQEDMLTKHDFVNVLDYFPGKGINGDKFPLPQALVSAKAMMPSFKGRFVVLLGANVARAFSVSKFRYLEWYDWTVEGLKVCSRVCIVPHPSGVNRYYNDPRAREEVSRFLKKLKEHAESN